MGGVAEGVPSHGTGAMLPDFNLEDLPTSKAPLMHQPQMCVVHYSVKCDMCVCVCDGPSPLPLLLLLLPISSSFAPTTIPAYPTLPLPLPVSPSSPSLSPPFLHLPSLSFSSDPMLHLQCLSHRQQSLGQSKSLQFCAVYKYNVGLRVRLGMMIWDFPLCDVTRGCIPCWWCASLQSQLSCEPLGRAAGQPGLGAGDPQQPLQS